MKNQMSLGRPERKPLLRRLLPWAVVAVLLIAGLAWFRVGPPPSVKIEPALPAVGPATPVTVTVEEPRRGLSSVVIELSQGERSAVLAEEEFDPRPFWAFWGDRTASRSFEAVLGPETLEGLQEGSATVTVTAGRAPTWLRRPEANPVSLELPVDLRPPSLDVAGGPYYATQGGSGVVVYRLNGAADQQEGRDGVRAGEWFFPGFPLPDGEAGERFALYAVPYDLETGSSEDGDKVELWAADAVGNEISVPFLNRLEAVPLKTDKINLDDGFLARVVPRIQAETPGLRPTGDLLQDYLAINRDLRKENAEELVALAEDSAEAFLWDGPFQQLPNSQVMSSFADRRTYVYQGEEVDRQDHLGFDLASVRQAPVPAANAGTVVLARYFGIYGRTVVLDHGYGLKSLYSHLSSIAVEDGQAVEKGTVLGRTGATGLAGGDHLHFTLMIQGLAVNPVEWWDRQWIERRILAPLNPGQR